MASRIRAKCADRAGMIRMAQQVAAAEGATQYLTPRHHGLDFEPSKPRCRAYIRIEPNGEVWQHSEFEDGGPRGPESPKRIA